MRFFWLADEARGHGFGQQLMHALEREATQRGVANLYLDTYTFQAPTFYLAAGFTEVGRYRDYLGEGVDKIFYQKTLSRSDN